MTDRSVAQPAYADAYGLHGVLLDNGAAAAHAAAAGTAAVAPLLHAALPMELVAHIAELSGVDARLVMPLAAAHAELASTRAHVDHRPSAFDAVQVHGRLLLSDSDVQPTAWDGGCHVRKRVLSNPWDRQEPDAWDGRLSMFKSAACANNMHM
jgi:hypothetical protein